MKTDTKLWVAVAALMVLVTGLGVWSGVMFLDQREQTTVAEKGKDVAEKSGQVVATEGDDLAARVQAACRAGGDAAKALGDTNACAQANRTRKTIEDAPVDPTPPSSPQQARYVPVPGARGPGPTLAQIGRAVNRVIDDAVSAQIDEAVREQIDAALLRACGGSCNGRDGTSPPPAEDGTNGTNGKDAPRITSIVCDGTTGVFRFSDDSTIRVNDMCDEPSPLEPAPEPEPSPDDSGLLTP